MSERRYRDDEIAEIFEASVAARSRRLTAGPDSGLTLADLQAIGREVGISPERIAEAAASLEHDRKAPAARTLLGQPITVRRTVTLPRPLTDREWEVLVGELRATFEARGNEQSQGNLRQWTNGNLHALVEPTASGARLRLGTTKGNAVATNWIGLAWLASSAFAMISTGPGEGLWGAAQLGILGAAMFLANAVRLPRWARTRAAQMEQIERRVRKLLSMSESSADEGTLGSASVGSGITVALLLAVGVSGGQVEAQQRLMNAPCTATAETPVTEPGTGRTYLLDYPCDLRPGEEVTLLLNLHGGGSSGNWQRRYFPAFDRKEEFRVVIASPYSPTRRWTEDDDEYLRNITSTLITELGAGNVKSFWLVGHSQGGSTSRRLICTPFFEARVDGFLSLSGGRLGGAAPRSPNAGRPRQAGEPEPAPPAPAPAAAPPAPPADPACDFSHIFAIGEHEITSLPAQSSLARRYGCSARVQESDVVDTEPGYVHDGGRQNPGTPAWGLLPRPGHAEVFVYPDCDGGRIVTDVVRIDKGHTEGLEPRVTEALVRMMASLEGGKVSAAGSGRPR